MLLEKKRYGYNDIMIQPSSVSKVRHRRECFPFKNKEWVSSYGFVDMLPIFAAPMSTVVDVENYDRFYENCIYAILPRNISWDIRMNWIKKGKWVAVSLKEFEEFVCNETNFENFGENYSLRILIDVANGNMQKIFDLCKKAKEIHKSHLVIMAGNVANVETYKIYCEANIDFCRVGVGGGAGCLTSNFVGIHDGIASLLNDITQQRIKQKCHGTKVVADGGIRGYSDVIKSLALGADYVMIGSLFAQTLESAGEIYEKEIGGKRVYIDKKTIEKEYGGNFFSKDGYGGKEFHYEIFKEFYGMASEEGQIAINGKVSKASEGLKRELRITTTLNEWSEKMISYLRSAMSYCGIYTVDDFNPYYVNCQIMSQSVQDSLKK